MRIKTIFLLLCFCSSVYANSDCYNCDKEKEQGFFGSVWSGISSLWRDSEEVTEEVIETVRPIPPVPPITTTPLPPKARYPQCIEPMPQELSHVICGSQIKGADCLIQEDQQHLTTNLIQKVESYDPDGIKECLFYENTRIIKRPSNAHLTAVARNSEIINQVAKELQISPVALACSIGADATLTRRVWGYGEKQEKLEHKMVNNGPSLHAIKFLRSRKIKMPSLTADDWNTEWGVIVKTGVILREAQESYKENGYDISQSVDVLSTLYNIGTFNDDGHSKAENRGPDYKPGSNFFGLYCLRYKQTYEDILK